MIHNHEVGGSSPPLATKQSPQSKTVGLFQLKNLEALLRGIFHPVFILFVLANPRSRAAGNRACELGEANARAGFKKIVVR